VNVASPSGASDAGPLLPATGLALVLDALCAAVAREGGRRGGLAGPLVILIWTRLKRMAARFAAAARLMGRPAVARVREVGRAPSAGAAPRLPGGFGWLIRLVPEAACHSGQVRHLLSQPEMQALLAASPAAARVLRPLCRMLAIAPDRETRAWLPGYGTRRRTVAAQGGRSGDPRRPDIRTMRPPFASDWPPRSRPDGDRAGFHHARGDPPPRRGW